MDYYNSNRELVYQEDLNKASGYEFEKKMDQLTLLQLENFLQQTVLIKHKIFYFLIKLVPGIRSCNSSRVCKCQYR